MIRIVFRMQVTCVSALWSLTGTVKLHGHLLDGAVKTLKQHGTDDDNIIIKHVPGSFELTLGAQFLAEYDDLDAVICLGCVIQGETPHFNYICQGVTQGITSLNMEYNIPFIFGVLTTNTHQQAADRAGGKLAIKVMKQLLQQSKWLLCSVKWRNRVMQQNDTNSGLPTYLKHNPLYGQ